jgi:sialic acid synthase SpsE
MRKLFTSNFSKRGNLNRPYIIAELNTSHNGSLDLAKKMIYEAKQVGADCVKFQSFSPESLFSEKYLEKERITKRIFERVSLSNNELKVLATYSREIGLDFASTAYTKEELDFLVKNCNPAFLKVASMDINNYVFLRQISSYELPIILSTGMSYLDEIDRAVDLIYSKNKNLILLHCTSNYPTKLEDANLLNIRLFQERYPKIEIGYSDHTIGTLAPTLASQLGAKLIEKHFTLDNKIIGIDNKMATDPIEFKKMVLELTNQSKVLGSYDRIVGETELNMRDKMRRSVVLTKSINAGDIITADMLTGKRPGNFIPISAISDIVGKTAKIDLFSGDYLLYDHIDEGDNT